MAPKKKGRKKKEAPKEPEPADDIVPEFSRESYLIQIRDLEGRVARYQQQWEEQQVTEDRFRSEYNKVLRDNKEIVAFLKKTLNQRVDEIADLTEQLQNLQLAKDTEKEAFEVRLVRLRREFQETKDQLTSDNMRLSGELAFLEECRIQKDELMAKCARMEEQLKKQEADHKEYIYNLEKKAELDKERLKKEALHRLSVVAAEHRKVSNSQMPETTKHAIRENAALTVQLTKVTDQSLEFSQENDHLKEALPELTKKLNLMQHNEKILAKKGLSNQKLIKMLTSKCEELQAQLDECAHQQKAVTELQKATEALEKQVVMLKAEKKKKKEEMAGKLADQQVQAKLLQEVQQRRKAMEVVLRRTVQGLEKILSECPAVGEQDQLLTSLLRGNDILQGLLSLLNESVARAEEPQGLRPLQRESEGVKLSAAETSSHKKSVMHLKASRRMSHCHLEKPWTAHSMPTLSLFSEPTFLDPLHSYASAPEVAKDRKRITAPRPVMSWKQSEASKKKKSEASKKKKVVIKEEHSEELPCSLGEEGEAEELSLADESSLLGEASSKAGS